MKRYLVVAVALVLVVSLGLALTGCGGDTGKAKEYINNAGVIIEEVEGESSEMEAQIETIFTELESGVTIQPRLQMSLPTVAQCTPGLEDRAGCSLRFKGHRHEGIPLENVGKNLDNRDRVLPRGGDVAPDTAEVMGTFPASECS